MPIRIVHYKVWVKRESGENPERSRHCVRERALVSLRNRDTETWEEKVREDRSQETCLFLAIMICGTRIIIHMDFLTEVIRPLVFVRMRRDCLMQSFSF